MKFKSLLALVAISPIALAQTTIHAPAGGSSKQIQPTPVEPNLSILSVTPTQAAEPGVMIMTGTGLDRVEYVALGGIQATILSREPEQLTFLPREGDPGPCMAVAATRFEWAQLETMLLPCLAAKEMESARSSLFQQFQPLGHLVEIELVSGVQGFYAIWMSAGQRRNPLVLDPPIAYEFWLGEPYFLLTSGFMPAVVDRIELQYRLPFSLWGRTVFFQGHVLQQYPTHERRSFTNMEVVNF